MIDKEEAQRGFQLREVYNNQPELVERFLDVISDYFDLRPSHARAYLDAFAGIYMKYGEDLERMSEDGLIMLIKRNKERK